MDLPDALGALAEAAERKDRAGVDEGVAQLRAGGFDAFHLSATAVICKENGFRDAAEAVLTAATAAHPRSGVLFFELGVIYMVTGRHNPAAAAFMQACRLDPEDARFAADLVLALHTVGAHPEAAVELARARALPDSDFARLDQLEEFGRYLAEFPAGRGRFILDEVRRRYDWVDTHRVAREIEAAMDEGRGFSLVRLGDGEGPFARISPQDEARYPVLYAWLRREWATLLFGEAFNPQATGYAALGETLMEVCAEADVAGVPYPAWLEHEYAISSQRGVPGLLNIHRWFLARSDTDAKQPLLCDQLIHINLHREGLLEPIIRRSRRIALISSNAQLPEMLKARFELEEVELFKIPAERYSSGLRDQEALAGVHFPFAFWDIIRALSKPQEGRVVLIAAGTLAKFYAATVKQHGGIALDIGSLVDGWMKIASRPGYEGGIAM